jgi:hypothetical protein
MAAPDDVMLPESRDVSGRWIVALGIGLVLLLAVSLVLLWFFYGRVSSGPTVGYERPDPAARLAEFEAQEQAAMGALGWIDRDAGIARIAVADAMAAIARRGKLPDWNAPAPQDGECAVLEGNVPRTPAAANCRSGWNALRPSQ